MIKALPALCRLRRETDALGKEACHKLARKIAREARTQGVAIVFFARNKGLKSASGLSARFERLSHNVAHNRLAKDLRDKLWELGIAMVETEESFASAASFVDGDPMPVHPEGRRQTELAASKAKAKAKAKRARIAASLAAKATPAKTRRRQRQKRQRR